MISPELLRRCAHFARCEDEVLQQVALLSEERAVPAGAFVYREGDAPEDLLLLLSGELDVLLSPSEGGQAQDVVVDSLAPGDLLGWSALTLADKRSASCLARRDSRLVAIDAAGLLELCEESPRLGHDLQRGIIQGLAERLQRARVMLAAAG